MRLRRWIAALALAWLCAAGPAAAQEPAEPDPQATLETLRDALAAPGAEEDAPAQPEALADRMKAAQEALDALLAAMEGPGEPPTESMALVEQRLSGMQESLTTLNAAIESGRESAAALQEALALEAERIDAAALRIDGHDAALRQLREALDDHETRIEDNTLKLFEALIELQRLSEAIDAATERATRVERLRRGMPADGDASEEAEETRARIADLTAALAVALLLLGPAGLLLTQARPAPRAATVAAWLGAAFGAATLGFGILAGATLGGWIGDPAPHLAAIAGDFAIDLDPELVRRLVMFALLAGLAGAIPAAAISDRGAFAALGVGLIFGALAYPLAEHWMRGAEGAAGGGQGWAALAGAKDLGGTAMLGALGGLGALFLRRMTARGPRASQTQEPDAAGALLLVPALFGATLASPDGLFAPLQTALAILTGAAAAAAAAGAAAALSDATREAGARDLTAAMLAGALAAPGASLHAPLFHHALIGVLAAALCGALIRSRPERDGPGAVACAAAGGGLAGLLAPALVGPQGLLTRGIFETLLAQGVVLAAVVALAWAAAWPGALIVRALASRPPGEADGAP